MIKKKQTAADKMEEADGLKGCLSKMETGQPPHGYHYNPPLPRSPLRHPSIAYHWIKLVNTIQAI